MPDLFDVPSVNEPLASRMRPRTLEEFCGQSHIVGEGTVLRKAIETDGITSLIFWGPPGVGKSTLASIIANHTSANFESFSAVVSGVPELRKVIARADDAKKFNGLRTILFVDEIHRFNKAQQDALLPYVENGTVILIGATTENPYFEVNTPLISRARVFRFEKLTDEQVKTLILRAIEDKERGLGLQHIVADPEAVDHIVKCAGGDARNALNALELASKTAVDSEDGSKQITLDIAQQAVQMRVLGYDKGGDGHYDTISAFIKSMRGSDPDAAVYWLAKMLDAGEDPKFVARRMIVQASEDIGNADPMAMVVASSAAQAVQFVGMPEAAIPLAHAAIYLACAPKSNACYMALARARKDLKNERTKEIPMHLRNPVFKNAKDFGIGVGYKYPHDFPGNYVKQEYMPKSPDFEPYYRPTENGHEAKIKARLQRLKDIDGGGK